MAHDFSDTDRISCWYNDSNDEGHEQLFEDLFFSGYKSSQPVPNDLAKALQAIFISTNVLPKVASSDTMHIEIMQEICWGLQRFCMSNPSAIDYAWEVVSIFISELGKPKFDKDAFDVHAFAVTELKYWIAEFPSSDHCNMSGTTSNPVLDTDSSIVSITQAQLEEDEAQQLANLAKNRNDRKRCIVNKVIAARALRDGYAPSGPRSSLFQGASELRSIEFALQSNGKGMSDDSYQTSCDSIAATFQLRACAKNLLAILPEDGCTFPQTYRIPDLKIGPLGKEERLVGWKAALQTIIVGKRSNTNFALTAYASLALENLRNPRDETSAELFSFDSILF